MSQDREGLKSGSARINSARGKGMRFASQRFLCSGVTGTSPAEHKRQSDPCERAVVAPGLGKFAQLLRIVGDELSARATGFVA